MEISLENKNRVDDERILFGGNREWILSGKFTKRPKMTTGGVCV